MRFPDPLNLLAHTEVLWAGDELIAEEDKPKEGWRVIAVLFFMHSSLLCSLTVWLPAALGSDSRQWVCVCACVSAGRESCSVELQKSIHYSVEVILNYSYNDGENERDRKREGEKRPDKRRKNKCN